MYKAKLWDNDKWDIHSSYSSSRYENIFANEIKDDKRYHEQKYGTKEKDISSDYIRKEESNEIDDKKNSNALDDIEDKNEQEIKEEDVLFHAAKQIFSETIHEAKEERKRDIKTIDEAIKKAIEEEKKVILIDN